MKLALTLLLTITAFVSNAQAQSRWVASWGASPIGVVNQDTSNATVTVRNFVRLSGGGSALRIIVSNEFGTEPLMVGGGTVGFPNKSGGGSLQPASIRKVTFAGQATFTIPPGALVYSDPITMVVPALSDLAVSLLVPAQKISNLTVHGSTFTTNYIAPGDQLSSPTLAGANTVVPWRFLKGVEVLSTADAAAIVCLGDSITDGAGSTVDANARWTNVLASRLQANPQLSKLSVVNEGIGGNRILHDISGPAALARFDRDVLAQTGVRYLILLEGINDIGHTNPSIPMFAPVTATDLIAGMLQIIDRAHAHNIKVIGATLTPYEGAKYSFPAGEEMREAVNTFIRTSGKFDGVIDFDRAVADPAHPKAIQPAFDRGDHLHPSPAGYSAMGSAIDLSLFAH